MKDIHSACRCFSKFYFCTDLPFYRNLGILTSMLKNAVAGLSRFPNLNSLGQSCKFAELSYLFSAEFSKKDSQIIFFKAQTKKLS